eukprot:TRINITY_DN350_c0_g1_i6.p4 TRINITY_DN350_c0_g1~~TRINITY_DN350_c0_g1_i6.p4  ORF type:complete len:125 (-),score=28.78 TRINITY_DN350_c0_g1_i6:393-767(-)
MGGCCSKTTSQTEEDADKPLLSKGSVETVRKKDEERSEETDIESRVSLTQDEDQVIEREVPLDLIPETDDYHDLSESTVSTEDREREEQGRIEKERQEKAAKDRIEKERQEKEEQDRIEKERQN